MAHAPDEDIVWILVVRGNLAHRIEFLGVEKADGELSELQRVLRHAALEQGFGSDPPERPDWANKAFVYVTQEHAGHVRDAIRLCGIQLQSKHIVVSNHLFLTVTAALKATPTGTKREKFEKRRAGAVSDIQRIRVPRTAFTWHALAAMADTGGDPEDDLPRPPGHAATAAPPIESGAGPAGTAAPPPPGARIHLLELDKAVMDVRTVDIDLLEFATSPPSAQCLSPELWLDIWRLICSHNAPHLALGPAGPQCLACQCAADIAHLLRHAWPDADPLLLAVLAAGRRDKCVGGPGHATVTARPQADSRLVLPR